MFSPSETPEHLACQRPKKSCCRKCKHLAYAGVAVTVAALALLGWIVLLQRTPSEPPLPEGAAHPRGVLQSSVTDPNALGFLGVLRHAIMNNHELGGAQYGRLLEPRDYVANSDANSPVSDKARIHIDPTGPTGAAPGIPGLPTFHDLPGASQFRQAVLETTNAQLVANGQTPIDEVFFAYTKKYSLDNPTNMIGVPWHHHATQSGWATLIIMPMTMSGVDDKLCALSGSRTEEFHDLSKLLDMEFILSRPQELRFPSPLPQEILDMTPPEQQHVLTDRTWNDWPEGASQLTTKFGGFNILSTSTVHSVKAVTEARALLTMIGVRHKDPVTGETIDVQSKLRSLVLEEVSEDVALSHMRSDA